MTWRTTARIMPVVALGLLVLPATIQAQTCPCFTLQDLTAIIVDSCGCQNDLAAVTSRNCTGINVAPGEDCLILTRLGEGAAAVLNQPDFTAGPWECQWAYPPQPNPVEVLALTEAEAQACAELIAEYGEFAEPQSFECSIDLLPCTSDADCTSPLGFCSIDGQSCAGDPDCPPAGTCSALGETCRSDADCDGFLNFCQDLQSQTCDFQTNFCDMKTECLDECFPPGCDILPTAGPSDLVEIVFTSQTFDVVSGDLSELRADGDFSRAACTPAVNFFYANAIPLSPDEAAYFLVRAVEGVSCTDHGDSTLTPDPRRDLDDGGCPPP